MKIMNEAVRLFLAVSALILVGMLTAPMNSSESIGSPEIHASALGKSEKKSPHRSKAPLRWAERKPVQRKALSLKKS